MGFDALLMYGMAFRTLPMMAPAADALAAAADALAKLAAASEQAGARATAAAANYPLAAGPLFEQLATTVLPLTLALIAIGFFPLALVQLMPMLFAPKDALKPEPAPPLKGQKSGEMSDANKVSAPTEEDAIITAKTSKEIRKLDKFDYVKQTTATGTDETGIDETTASEKSK
jgi:hypothetical protein